MTKGSPASSLTASRPRLAGEAVPGRKRRDEALALHHQVLEAGLAVDRRQEQPEVELARRERRRLLGRKHLAQRERHARPGGLEGLEQPGEHAVVGERDEADAQPALLARGHAAQLEHRALELRDDAARLLEEAGALGGELDPPAAAREQRHAEPLLERADGARQRRLRDVQRLGGAAEMQPLGHRHEIPQLPQIRQIHTHRVLQQRSQLHWPAPAARGRRQSPPALAAVAGVYRARSMRT